MHWLLELDIFGDHEQRFADALLRAGHRVSRWNDDWWENGRFPVGNNAGVLFHGSLGNAARIRRELSWQPGAFCNTEAFRWSAWAPALKAWLLNPETIATTVREAAARSAELGAREVFVRPESPLKPFSGRVVAVDALTPEALDFGFYYEDLELPIIVAPKKEVGNEFRFVVAGGAGGAVIAGSAYVPEGRAAGAPIASAHPAWILAAEIAAALTPDPVYVLDICETPHGLRLLELNPFSGADLYNCDPEAIARHVSALCV